MNSDPRWQAIEWILFIPTSFGSLKSYDKFSKVYLKDQIYLQYESDVKYRKFKNFLDLKDPKFEYNQKIIKIIQNDFKGTSLEIQDVQKTINRGFKIVFSDILKSKNKARSTGQKYKLYLMLKFLYDGLDLLKYGDIPYNITRLALQRKIRDFIQENHDYFLNMSVDMDSVLLPGYDENIKAQRREHYDKLVTDVNNVLDLGRGGKIIKEYYLQEPLRTVDDVRRIAERNVRKKLKDFVYHKKQIECIPYRLQLLMKINPKIKSALNIVYCNFCKHFGRQ